MNSSDLQKHVAWLQHEDIRAFLASEDVPNPWFPAYRSTVSSTARETCFSALVPLASIPKLVKQSHEWDIRIGEGGPAIWSGFKNGAESQTYVPTGNTDGIEPLVIHRTFCGVREEFFELTQEFRLYHNLYPEPSRKHFLLIDNNGDASEAARYGDRFLEIRTDLVLKYCAIKQMALAIYVDSFRDSRNTLEELGTKSTRENHNGERHGYSLFVAPHDTVYTGEFKTIGSIIGKKYVIPGPMPADQEKENEVYQEFVIGTDVSGQPIRHISDPEKLANYFGKNKGAPYYLTPVVFRAEVLAKYYANPDKYSVEDGYLRCGSLWGLRLDNDHTDIVVVFLGDLGRDLTQTERNYWLSFNIAPAGQTVSATTFKRGFLAEFADPQKPDLVFKQEYDYFNRKFREANEWDLFLPLHPDDKHFLTGLRFLSGDNQAEFDSQLISLTKLLVDSLNEKKIQEGLATLAKEDKGITKLDKFFKERNVVGYEKHIQFLRVLQDLRSKSAAHRKGSSYDDLITDLQLEDEGQQRVFTTLLNAGSELLRFLRATLLPPESST